MNYRPKLIRAGWEENVRGGYGERGRLGNQAAFFLICTKLPRGSERYIPRF
jgi:hypothetical protein